MLAGRPTLRHPEGEEVLAPWDVVCFPTGPQGAHGLRNETDETVRVLMWSTVSYPAATVYPDTDKIAIWTGNRDDDLMVRRASAVDYYDGEGGGRPPARATGGLEVPAGPQTPLPGGAARLALRRGRARPAGRRPAEGAPASGRKG